MLTNHQKTLLLNIIASPLFIALPITLLIILFLPNPTSKYKIELKSKKLADKANSKVVFCDLNNDGKDERVISFHNNARGEASIKIFDNDGLVYDAWNFHGYFQSVSDNFFCSDIDNDGNSEIFVFYYHNDSVFLSELQPYPEKKIIIDERFLTTIKKRNSTIDYIISNFYTHDLNGDGYKEIVFSLSAGFSKQPRIIVCYDYVNDTLIKSKSVGAKFTTLQIIDINEDSVPELFAGSTTSANIHDSLNIPYNDYNSYFFGFNNDLEVLFTPMINPYYPSTVKVCHFENDKGEPLVAVLFINNGKKIMTLKYLDSNFKVTFEKTIFQQKMASWDLMSYMQTVKIKNKPYIFVGVIGDKFILIDSHGKVLKRDVFHDGISFRFYNDINKDGKREFGFVNAENDLFIYDQNLENPVKFMLNEPPFSTQWLNVGVKRNGKKENNVYLRTDNYLYLFAYIPDYYYYMKYPLWLILYAIVVVILWFTQRMQTIREKRKQHIEETINSLQIKTIKSQMDPHFMFNVLNGLANNVAKGSSDEAYSQILRFSKLLRSMMSKSERIDISLREELDFIKNYLELEKFRFKDDFEYATEISEDVDTNIKIPRMLIQLLVENSIKHGLRDKIGLKSILIKAYSVEGKTKITVEDNGVGRQKSQEKTTTGTGLKIIRDMISLNKKLTGKEISLNYTDLYDENGVAQGTSVEVII